MEDSNNSKTQIHVSMSIWEEFEMERKIHRIIPVTENNGELQSLFHVSLPCIKQLMRPVFLTSN